MNTDWQDVAKEFRAFEDETCRSVSLQKMAEEILRLRNLDTTKNWVKLSEELAEARAEIERLKLENYGILEGSQEWEESFHQAKALEKAAIQKWQRYKEELQSSTAANARLWNALQSVKEDGTVGCEWCKSHELMIDKICDNPDGKEMLDAVRGAKDALQQIHDIITADVCPKVWPALIALKKALGEA